MCTILGWFINNFSIYISLMEHLHMAYHLKGNSVWITYLVRKIVVIIWMIHLPIVLVPLGFDFYVSMGLDFLYCLIFSFSPSRV